MITKNNFTLGIAAVLATGCDTTRFVDKTNPSMMQDMRRTVESETEISNSEHGMFPDSVRISPDGRRVAYTALGEYARGYAVIDGIGGNLYYIVRNPSSAPIAGA